MDKIIFLDIDGVLNPTHYMNALYKMWNASNHEIKSHDQYGQLFFNQNVDALKHIIDKTGAKIVISSTWRMAGLSTMIAMWQYRNLPGEIIGITPHEIEVVDKGLAEFYDDVCRGLEIKMWMNMQNDIKANYVIIDDTQDMLPEQNPNFILTNGFVGLTMKDAERAIQVLNKK